MGGNICKSCHHYFKKDEQDLSQNLFDNNEDNYKNIFPNARSIISSRINIPESSQTTDRIINKSTSSKSIIKQDENSLYEKVQADESKLRNIIFNYNLSLVKSFRKLKKLKEEAHKIITLRKNLKEKRELILLDGKENLDVDLFPEQNYNFLGNIFKEKEDGFGIQYFPINKAKYVGYFLNGKRKNYCIFENKSKFYTYKGETKKNFTGLYGIYHNYKQEITYEGEWLNNRKDGIGIEFYKDGSKFQGEHKNGVKHGIGTYIWEDGSMYQGEWKYNLMDGYGIYKFKDGSICQGYWFSNQLNGFGKLTLAQVKCYIGFFKKDYKSGFGLLFWFKEKKAFVGFWKNNKQDGLGKFIYNEKIKYGTWKQGNRESKFEKNEFYNLLNEKNSSQIFLNIFEMDYDGLKEYIQNFNFF